MSRDYLNRIDDKNQQLLDAYQEIRQLHNEILKIVSSNTDDLRSMIDRFLKITDAHTEEVKLLTQK